MTTEQMLPGMEGLAPIAPPLSNPLETESAQIEASVPPVPIPRPKIGLARVAVAGLLALCVGAGAVAAYLLVPAYIAPSPQTVPETPQATDEIPLAILCGEDDVTAWKTVRNMHGRIGDAELSFKNGCARDGGLVYRIQLDFCRKNDTTFVRVCGDGNWVVRVADDGRILKAYPSPARAKTLRELLLSETD